jgi:hypothetical protein
MDSIVQPEGISSPANPTTTYYRISDPVYNIMLGMLLLIATRLILYMIGADNIGLVAMIYWITDIFSMPFQNIIPVISIGKFVLDSPAAVAGGVIFLGGNGLIACMDMFRMYRKYKHDENLDMEIVF